MRVSVFGSVLQFRVVRRGCVVVVESLVSDFTSQAAKQRGSDAVARSN